VVGPDTQITLFGNAWKAYKLDEPYTVSKNTQLKVDFNMITEAEGHAICVDSDNNEDTFGGNHIRCFMVGGTQMDRWDHVIPRPAEVEKQNNICVATTFTFDLKDIFLGDSFKINYIGFIQDNDDNPVFGESSFKNIKLFDKPISVGDTNQLVRTCASYWFE